jgi:hypothetical protein
MAEPYFATPGHSSRILPSKSFATEAEAVKYAQDAACTFRAGYAVWYVLRGRVRLVGRYPAPR